MSATVEVASLRMEEVSTPSRLTLVDGFKQGILSSGHQGRYRAARSPLLISSPAGRSDLLWILAEGLEWQHGGIGRAEREREVDGDQSVAEILRSGCGGSVGGRRGFEEVSVEVD
ncbi:hypothetical protein U1Q18_016788 [Sarracenia purpurea var. burkii]